MLEVLIAILALGTAATVFAAYLPTAMNTGHMVGQYQQASSIVQHKIDQLRSVGYGRLTYDQLLAAGIIDESPKTAPYSFQKADKIDDHYVGTTATISVDPYSSDVKQVTVTLKWTGGVAKPSEGNLTVTALIAKG
ncbi:MAG: hypothetical protein JST30_15765 [Armatimonadetes bacterium]|nr:hypothetical protein [Armatimonadota bacterium]